MEPHRFHQKSKMNLRPHLYFQKLFYPPARGSEASFRGRREEERVAAAKTAMQPPQNTPRHTLQTSPQVRKQNKNNTPRCHVHKTNEVTFEEVTFWTSQLADPSAGRPPGPLRTDPGGQFLTPLRGPKSAPQNERGTLNLKQAFF